MSAGCRSAGSRRRRRHPRPRGRTTPLAGSTSCRAGTSCTTGSRTRRSRSTRSTRRTSRAATTSTRTPRGPCSRHLLAWASSSRTKRKWVLGCQLVRWPPSAPGSLPRATRWSWTKFRAGPQHDIIKCNLFFFGLLFLHSIGRFPFMAVKGGNKSNVWEKAIPRFNSKHRYIDGSTR
ncbi:hypothetical protein VTG60DRAFT_2117 [Thermothelomyces hinnuleus]